MIFEKGKIKATNNKGTWTKKEDWSTEDEVYEFLYGIVRAVKPKKCLESGTFKGDGSIAIALALKENDNGGFLYTIDHHNFGASEKLKEYKNIAFISGTAPQVFQTIDLSELEFIFLDSGHDYEQVTKELYAIDSYLKVMGYILVHDVLHSNWGAGASKAIQDFIKQTNSEYSYIFLTSYNGLGILQKIGYTKNSKS